MDSFAIIAISLIAFIVIAYAIALVFVPLPPDSEPGEDA